MHGAKKDFSTKSTTNRLEEHTVGHKQLQCGLLYKIDGAHPSEKGLGGFDIRQLMATLDVNNRPRWAPEFILSFIRPLTVHESEMCKVYSRNTLKKIK